MKPQRPARTSRRPAGFTLIEVLITALVIGTAFVAATWSMAATAKTKAAYDQASSPAPFLAQEIFTLADGLPRVPSGTTGVTSGAAVFALDSLEGASFSPPILADGSEASGFDDWQQDVDLSIHSIDDLDHPADLDPADGLPPESSFVYRLEVSVRHEGEVVDTFSWWIHP
jgi:prepilin-type N-terminal cleavage/methylation domain-containing protein